GASLCSILPRWISIDGHFAVLRKIERSAKKHIMDIEHSPHPVRHDYSRLWEQQKAFEASARVIHQKTEELRNALDLSSFHVSRLNELDTLWGDFSTQAKRLNRTARNMLGENAPEYRVDKGAYLRARNAVRTVCEACEGRYCGHAGQHCTDDNDCFRPLICNNGYDPHRCERPGDVGSRCAEEADCQPGLRCMAEKLICIHKDTR
ncbi:MAG: hypothetical protein JXR96_21090, partial [Deltaproteobacteria bacterium]|nr:hypothetical protein [Deltaproteobacteria bacterium]